jgi:hypothetical protein
MRLFACFFSFAIMFSFSATSVFSDGSFGYTPLAYRFPRLGDRLRRSFPPYAHGVSDIYDVARQ